MVLTEFTPFVDKAFEVDCSPRTAVLTLVEASPLRDRPGADRPPFALIFRSEPNVQLVSGLYPLQCGGFGPELVHLSPILPAADAEPGNYYQAIFN